VTPGADVAKPRNVIEIDDLMKVYRMGEIEIHALRGVSLDIKEGELLSIMGPSVFGSAHLGPLLD
jgi:putative ABC transport system ATP-binding protein